MASRAIGSVASVTVTGVPSAQFFEAAVTKGTIALGAVPPAKARGTVWAEVVSLMATTTTLPLSFA
ncbi:uncharacterized protein SOCE836_054640 [Sorangium cellulosum]|uniref:Uncharacterized protein n=1 Tax=Sorangium cellulosum TaxID=56 RepID=A0A4P2QSP9_SORCE|nr:uncharacterized protein SOCE836_054640 [Sorangium cellulosum]WCQ92622.1 hypothetical protein NQZ70_05365 [Sorangium sp. Soce836]